MKAALAGAKEVLHKAGYKATPQRAALVSVLMQSSEPLSIAKIQRALPKKGGDLATVYRTLLALEKVFLVRQVDLRHGHAHYEWTADRPHHHHLVCTSCGLTEEYDQCEFADFSKKALAKSKQFATIEDHASELFGLCKKCHARR